MIDLDDDRWRATLLAAFDQAEAEGRSGWSEASHPRGPGGKFADVPGLSLHTVTGKRKGIAHTTITAKQYGSKVGHIRLTGGGSEIDDLHVPPAHRGKGIAHKLMQTAIDKFGHQTMRLHASPFGKGGLDKDNLQAFYAKHGFEPEAGRGPGYMIRKPRTARSADWNEELHPRGPGGKFGHGAGGDALAKLDQWYADEAAMKQDFTVGGTSGQLGDFNGLNEAMASGIDDVTPLSGGSIALSVSLVRFGNGQLGVAKEDRHQERSDRELLVSHVGHALGAPVPAVIDDPEMRDQGVHGVMMQHVAGKTLAEAGVRLESPQMHAFEQSDAGRRLGLMDAITGNDDRNPGNLIIQPSGDIAGIDHGNADFEAFHGNHPISGDPLPDGLVAREPLLRQFVDTNGVLWKSGGFSPSEFDQMRSRLRDIRPEFERTGRGDWFDLMMDRFEAIAKTAKGPQVSDAEMDAPPPGVDLGPPPKL